MIGFFYFVYILVGKHVKVSDISSVKSLNTIDIQNITDTTPQQWLDFSIQNLSWQQYEVQDFIILYACILVQYIEGMGERIQEPSRIQAGTDIIYQPHM